MNGQLRTFLKSIGRSLFDRALRHKARKRQVDAKSQTLNEADPVASIVTGEKSMLTGLAEKESLADAPDNRIAPQGLEPQQGCPLKVQGL
jgi:hypothetical protein